MTVVGVEAGEVVVEVVVVAMVAEGRAEEVNGVVVTAAEEEGGRGKTETEETEPTNTVIGVVGVGVVGNLPGKAAPTVVAVAVAVAVKATAARPTTVGPHVVHDVSVCVSVRLRLYLCT